MISPFKRAPVAKVSKHIIVDGREWPIEREYAELGMRNGWLIRHRVKTLPNGERVNYYLYPNSGNTE